MPRREKEAVGTENRRWGGETVGGGRVERREKRRKPAIFCEGERQGRETCLKGCAGGG